MLRGRSFRLTELEQPPDHRLPLSQPSRMEAREQSFLGALRTKPSLDPGTIPFVAHVDIFEGSHSLLSLRHEITVGEICRKTLCQWNVDGHDAKLSLKILVRRQPLWLLQKNAL
jgi:hypothetical protein